MNTYTVYEDEYPITPAIDYGCKCKAKSFKMAAKKHCFLQMSLGYEVPSVIFVKLNSEVRGFRCSSFTKVKAYEFPYNSGGEA